MMNTGNPIYNKLYLKASKHVKFYREDLTHYDKKELTEKPELPFLHLTRETGTTLIFLFIPFESFVDGYTIEESIQVKKDIFDHFFKPNKLKSINYFDSKNLNTVRPRTASQIFSDFIVKETARLKVLEKENQEL